MQRNDTYWEDRKAQNMFEYMQSTEDTADKVSQVYIKASRYLNHQIDKVFDRYVTKHGLTEKEAYRLLNSLKDKTSIEEMLKRLKTGLPSNEKKELIKLLESQPYRARIDRLQELQTEIDLLMNSVYQQERDFNTSHYINLAQESYYKSMFDIQQMSGYGFNFSALSAVSIDNLLKSKWSGENYSSRIWSNSRALAQNLKEELLINLLTGRTNNEVSKIIQNKFAQSASNARRLVRTESNYIANEIEMLSYEESEIETYIFVATLDLRTSSICRNLDGKRFKVKNRQPGLNCPPMHPWCRSTTICNITDEELANMKRRAKNPITGKNELVPANMTYGEWYQKYVANNPEALKIKKKVKHLSADKKQYEGYKNVLGKEYVPETIEDFQNMKYANNNEYGILKAQYKGMSYYNKAVANESEITEHVKKVAQMANMDIAGIEYRIKSKDSYLRKISSNYSPDGNEYEIKDIIRYTYTSSADELVEKTLKSIDIHNKLGYNTIELKNYWLDNLNPYNGINSIIKSRSGQKFELQYHTPESFELKNGDMHKLYEQQRLIKDTSSEEYMKLNDQMFELSDTLEIPKNIKAVIKK